MSNRLRLRDNRNNPDAVELMHDEHETDFSKMTNFDTNVEPDDLIIWELDPRSLTSPPTPGYFPIKSIDHVVQTFEIDGGNYKESIPVLKADPVNAGGAFVANVQTPSPGKGKAANYKIEFTLPDDSKHFVDPKIQLNS
jgi:hypothetical protein